MYSKGLNFFPDLVFLLDKEEDEYTEEIRQPGLYLTLHSDGFFPDIYTDGIQVESMLSYSFAIQQVRVKNVSHLTYSNLLIYRYFKHRIDFNVVFCCYFFEITLKCK